MKRDDKLIKVKKDLQKLRFLSHKIETNLEVKERHEKRLTWLKSKEEQTKETLLNIEKINNFLKTLNIENYINKASEIENAYMDAINKLDSLDRTIILEGFINGKPYWKIGREIGFSESGIQKRVNNALKKISKLI